jgi:hypothetical protein
MANPPIARLVFKSKEGEKWECGVVWGPKSDRAPEALVGSLQAVAETTNGERPKMALAEAIQRAANREGFIDIWRNEPRDKPRDAPREQPSGDDGGGGDFDDIPFAAVDDRLH